MSIQFYWFAPSNGDGSRIGLKKPERAPTLDYLVKVARTVEEQGFDGILVPVGIPFLDSWMVGSAIVHHTSRLKPLIAFRPGFIAPSLAAKMASTLDQFSAGRLTINVVTGGSPYELGQDGDFTGHDERYTRTDEFLTVVRKLWDQSVVDHEGNYFKLSQSTLIPAHYDGRKPPIYFGGSSPAALEVAAKHADVYLQWGEPLAEVKKQIEELRRRAEKYGRFDIELGIRIHVIVRDTEEEAWAAARLLLEDIEPEVEARMANYFKEADSVAQTRMNELLKGDYRFDKNKWAGIGRVRKGAGTAVVGTPQQVWEGLKEYMELGVTHFILSGFPHVEEAERFGRTVLPIVRSESF
jgi:alkanesulfonate monooxygenase